MSRRRFKSEKTVNKLRKADVLLSQAKSIRPTAILFMSSVASQASDCSNGSSCGRRDYRERVQRRL